MLPGASGVGSSEERGNSGVSSSSDYPSPGRTPRLLHPVIGGGPSHSQFSGPFTYTPCYCEENVYLLCKQLSLCEIDDPKPSELYAVFISNEEKQVPLFRQKASEKVDGLVVWDYHVICIQSRSNGDGCVQHLVWDLDSSLPMPMVLDEYVHETLQPFPSPSFMPRRYFRVVHAPIFFRSFGSDRSHMKDSSGNWLSPPPNYDPIVAEDGSLDTINEYIKIHAADQIVDMSLLLECLFSQKLGVVVREDRLVDLFSWISSP